MASFPTAVFSPASKSNGQTIEASHVNDLDGEVVAIESGYLNGTARLNSSNSTLANLSVSGGSTFASRPSMPPPEAVRVTGCTNVLENNSTTALLWPAQVYAINSSVHSTGTNPERFTPQSSGLFAIAASIQLGSAPANSTAWIQLEVLDSSGTQLGLSIMEGFAGSQVPTIAVYASKYFPTAAPSTQWVRVVAKQGSGSSNTVFGAGSWCEFRKL